MTQAATPFVAESIAGPRCGGCRLTEQTCAREYPCCENCTHFAEPERPLDLTPDRPRQEPPMTTPIRDTITDLLARARPITDSKIRRAVARVDQAHAQLREALTDHEGKAAARREVERLERQLAEARSKLRGGVYRPAQPQEPRARRTRPMPQRLRPHVHHGCRPSEPRTQLHRTGRLI